MSREQSSPARAWTGGAAGASGLVLITLHQSSIGQLAIDATRSAHFVLGDDTQDALRQVFAEISEFASGSGIREIVFRRPQPSGPDAAGSKARRLQAAIELVPGLVIHSANNQSLGRWCNHHWGDMPPLEPDPPRQDRWLYEGAVGAARVAFGIDTGELKLVDGCVR